MHCIYLNMYICVEFYLNFIWLCSLYGFRCYKRINEKYTCIYIFGLYYHVDGILNDKLAENLLKLSCYSFPFEHHKEKTFPRVLNQVSLKPVYTCVTKFSVYWSQMSI